MVVTGQPILLFTFQGRLGEASQLAKGLKSFCGAAWASHVGLTNGSGECSEMQRDESPPSCACRGRAFECEIITAGAPVGLGKRETVVDLEEAHERATRPNTALCIVHRASWGMLSPAGSTWAAIDLILRRSRARTL